MAASCEPLDLSIKQGFKSLILQVDGSYPSVFQSGFAKLSGLADDIVRAQPLDLRVDTSTSSTCSSMSIEEDLTINTDNDILKSGKSGKFISLVTMIIKLRKQQKMS